MSEPRKTHARGRAFLPRRLLAFVVLASALLLAPEVGSGETAGKEMAETTEGQPEACVDGPVFEDRATGSGLRFVHWNGMTGNYYLPEITGSGLGVLDFDGDGDLDVYLVQMNLLAPDETVSDAILPPPGEVPLTDRLYRNDSRPGDGSSGLRFVDVTGEAGLEDATGYGMGIAAGDLSNDGVVDLYLTNLGPNQLWIGGEDGRFRELAATAGAQDRRWSVPALLFDLDRDGRLDLFVGSYVDFRIGTHRVCQTATGAPDWCGPLSYDPTPDRLFRNLGDGRFADVTQTAGLGDATGAALGALAVDVDGDRWLDIYVANDQTENFLWMNGGEGTFANDAPLAGAAVSGEGRPQASMGVDAADVDEDGDFDLFMTHLTDEPNTFYLNDGQGNFLDASQPSGLGMESWEMTGFGTGFVDYDNDGRLDVLAVNGAVRAIPEQMGPDEPYPLRQSKQLFRNLGGGRFQEVTERGGEVLGIEEVSRGAAFGDIEGDGDSDVVVNNSNGPARLLVNDCGHRNRWIGLEVIDGHGREALGATVILDLGDGSRLIRRVHTDGSFASSSDPRVLIGLAGRTDPESVTVTWPDGDRTRYRGPRVGGYQRLVRNGGDSR
ncbi:MAG: CRTAC1 family protein [Halobacteriales archaeon]|nr:CRTAC1 family protein [Halobacteriales archaeon]